ncbi:OLC1v1016250C1 [Oldenlandia corymbosa var. corymbosa]|uniref:OLC1v1016250C1 n=1 Tax=Oldenlandia corymbosa var. corymbosa TaxID=529605 RepID=A0AAV1E5J7_OLDCO|nr:OLC1v1016250C1 [Oldenlandia corymbosa var. corymbosa]
MAMRPVGRGGRRTAATPSRQGFGGGVQAVYEDFRPMSEWQQDKESDILLIYLPGFQKQNLKVSTEGQNIVRARGDRLDAGNKWSRFLEDYKVPERCDIRAVRARFEGGILTITLPWKKEYQHHHQTHQEAPPIPPPPSTEQVAPKKTTAPSPAGPVAPKTESTTPAIVIKPPKAIDDKFEDAPEGPDQPKKSVPQKGFNDKPSEVLSPLPLPAFGGSSGKQQKENMLKNVQPYDPLFKKGEDHEQQKKQALSTDPPLQEPAAALPSTKESYWKSENLKRSKEEEEKSAADDNMESASRKKRKEGVVDGGAERVAQGPEKQVMMSPPVATNRLRNYKEAVRSFAELNEERQLLVNVGAAVLVIVALGTYIITSTVASGEPN